MTSKWQSLSVLANHKALYPRYPWNECSQSDTGFREVLHNLCGKILRNLKMALNNIKKDFGKNLYGIWSPGNRFLWQVFSAKSTLVSFRSFTWRVPVASCFFQCLGQKEIDKIPSDWENSSKDTRSKWGEVFSCFPLSPRKKKRKKKIREKTWSQVSLAARNHNITRLNRTRDYFLFFKKCRKLAKLV